MKQIESKVLALLASRYGLHGQLSVLPGELDLNFRFIENNGCSYVAKVANASESKVNLELQNAMINHLARREEIGTQTVIKTLAGEEIVTLNDELNTPRFFRLMSWVDGRVLAKVNPHSPVLLQHVGETCGVLCGSFAGFDHSAAHRFMKWDPSQMLWVAPHLALFKGERRSIADHFFQLFGHVAVPLFPLLRKSVNYNDANDYNILVSPDLNEPKIAGIIDFGDAVYTHTVNELAIAIAYTVMEKPDPVEAACHVVKGFNSQFKLTEQELKALLPLVGARLLISVVCAELNRIEHPDNEYLQISDAHAWNLLKKLKNVHPDFAEACFRQVCSFTPSPKENLFQEWLSANAAAVIQPIYFKTCSWLDLSVESLELGNTLEFADADVLDRKLTTLIQESGKDVALGKYDEVRAFYNAPAFEVITNESVAWRTVHLGLDFFCPAGTPVKAAVDGTVHSFTNNSNDRDYGPAVILKHHVSEQLTFYTLYGHLNTGCLDHLVIGKKVKAGDTIGKVGARSENGNWTPHLHFQVMLDVLGKHGDFPGVSTPAEAPVWKSICPDPWRLLTGTNSPEGENLSKEDIVLYRKQHLGKNLGISYKEPIKMVRGAGQYLIDNTGRKYLDTVNNVAHVGHENPRVVSAGQRQMAVLNTNTRYLHQNIVKFVEALLATMPPKLDVAFVVNSGSEANELSMRLAKTYTGQKDMIVSEVGYHGNTNACIDISSYKFDGPGGKGRQPHIHVVPIPDTYRGLYRAEETNVGSRYAQHVKQAIEIMQAENRKPAAFIFESVISCGGQVELPEGFLKEAYAYTRHAGGVCVADEVQTGCGRAGDHFWAFQKHDVVPDIVTIGKPIGNGHPLGVVVTTQALADAFKNGMEYFNTFGGNPVSCAIGLEVLKVIADEKLQHNAKVAGEYLKLGLRSLMREFPIIGDVRGPGLFIGFELVKDRDTKEPATDQASYFANRMRDKGILMSTDGPFNNVLKIKPPIIFSKADSDFLLEFIRRVLKEDYMQPASRKKINVLS